MSKHSCGCTRVMGMDHCVAEYIASTDSMVYHGVPCMYCGKRITIDEGEERSCIACRVAEYEVAVSNNWYVEMVYGFYASSMHQPVFADSTGDMWLDAVLRSM